MLGRGHGAVTCVVTPAGPLEAYGAAKKKSSRPPSRLSLTSSHPGGQHGAGWRRERDWIDSTCSLVPVTPQWIRRSIRCEQKHQNHAPSKRYGGNTCEAAQRKVVTILTTDVNGGRDARKLEINLHLPSLSFCRLIYNNSTCYVYRSCVWIYSVQCTEIFCQQYFTGCDASGR